MIQSSRRSQVVTQPLNRGALGVMVGVGAHAALPCGFETPGHLGSGISREGWFAFRLTMGFDPDQQQVQAWQRINTAAPSSRIDGMS